MGLKHPIVGRQLPANSLNTWETRRDPDAYLGTMPRGRPRKTVAPRPNRLAELRIDRGLTQEKVAATANIAPQTLGKLERGELRLRVDLAETLAKLYSVELNEILASATSRMVPVVGYVGDGTRIYLFEDAPGSPALRQVSCPRGLDPGKVVAVEVRGDAMFPIGDGWILFYSSTPAGVPYEAVGQMCIVKTDEGTVLIKNLRRGYSRGRFNLLALNGAPIDDAALDWAAPIYAMVAPDIAGLPESAAA